MYCIYGIYKSVKRTIVCLSRIMLVSIIWYMWDNVLQNAGHYRESKPRQGEPDPDANRRCLASPWRVLFLIMARSMHYPAYYTAPCQNETISSQCVFLQLPFVVLINREIICQRRWRCLPTGHAEVDKLPYYLRSEDVKSTFLDSGRSSSVCIKVPTICELLQLLMPLI